MYRPVVIDESERPRFLELLLAVVGNLGDVEGEGVVPQVLPHHRVGRVRVGQVLVDLNNDWTYSVVGYDLRTQEVQTQDILTWNVPAMENPGLVE